MKYKKEAREPDNWKTLADIFSGLMLMFLLILMLIVLFVGYKDEIKRNELLGDRDGGYEDRSDDDGGGGGGYEDEETDLVYDDGLAAVQVVVVDGETGEIIEAEGIDFHLFSGDRSNQINLNTYYPETVSYSEFETRPDGKFFLPEKLQENTYVLKNLTAPEGYIGGDSTTFTVSGAYYWEDPYVVYFPLSMNKYSLAIMVTDKDTGAPVPYGEYEIATAEGVIVGRIVCDAGGFGQSEPLGQRDKYIITQSYPAEFYSVLEYPITVSLEGSSERVVDIPAAKTAYEINMTDELNKTPIEGATLTVYEDGILFGEFKTDTEGLVRLTNLNKNSSYSVRQTGFGDKWLNREYETKFYVDGMGRINGYSVCTVTGTNRMIRLSIKAEDRLFGLNLRGEALTLEGENGQTVHSWVSERDAHLIEGLLPGRYTLKGEDGGSMEILIEDTAEIQRYSYKIFNPVMLILVIVLGMGVSACIVILVISMKKKKDMILDKVGESDES